MDARRQPAWRSKAAAALSAALPAEEAQTEETRRAASVELPVTSAPQQKASGLAWAVRHRRTDWPLPLECRPRASASPAGAGERQAGAPSSRLASASRLTAHQVWQSTDAVVGPSEPPGAAQAASPAKERVAKAKPRPETGRPAAPQQVAAPRAAAPGLVLALLPAC